MNTDDLWENAGMQEWVAKVREDLVPKLRDSAATISIVPKGDTDIKYAVELGLSIMFDKPIILMVQPGARVPDKLAQIADLILEIDLDSPTDRETAGARIREFLETMANDGTS